MDSIADILAAKDFTPPDEIKAIKDYVALNYRHQVGVKLGPNEIVVTSPSAGLISSLRLNTPALARAAQTKKRIRFQID